MAGAWRPTSADEVREAVRDAAADGTRLEIVGTGSRRGLGHAAAADAVLDLSGLGGVVSYQPEELVLTVRPGARMSEIKALLDEANQHLAFEPPDPLALEWNGRPDDGTIGGAMSVGHGGPRRITAGSARDHLLGFKAVNGFGEAFAAGGRVVKNVTGFDLCKLMAGAFGTLGPITEMTLKVLPKPEAVRTLVMRGLAEADGLAALRLALASPAPVTGAAHLPFSAAHYGMHDLGQVSSTSATVIRLEGVASAMRAHEAALVQTLGLAADGFRWLDDDLNAWAWSRVGGGHAIAWSDWPVWRIGAPPASAAALGPALRDAGVELLYHDWGGGVQWAGGPKTPDAGAAAIRAALKAVAGEGHATLVRGHEGLDPDTPRFQPLEPGVAGLTARIKAQFDPLGLFNPGRMGGLA